VFIGIVVAYGWAMNHFERQDLARREAQEPLPSAHAADRPHG